MRSRLWPVLLAGFGALVLLVAISGVTALRRTATGYAGITELYERQRHSEDLLERLRADILNSAVDLRDYLLDPSAEPAAAERRIRSYEQTTSAKLDELRPLIAAGDQAQLNTLREGFNLYWRAIDPLFANRGLDRAHSADFLRKQVVPHRRAALALLSELENLTRDSLQHGRTEIDARTAGLPYYVGNLILTTILIGLGIAAAVIFRIWELEKVAERQRAAVEKAEHEMRGLSQRLVMAHEEERRSLSRELHDQVGQTLTAIRINLGNLEEALNHHPEQTQTQLEQARRLSEQALRTVRDLAMGLRPAMLDDLGLGAALEWQARQHSRICKVPVTVHVNGDLDALSDAHRTCVYRIVQEALTNAARHAHASAIQVNVGCDHGAVSMSIRDDGQGFDPDAPRAGLGLVGMKERVRQLGGKIVIESQPGRGSAIAAEIPLAAQGSAS
jgi:signal transduction histidine kinase